MAAPKAWLKIILFFSSYFPLWIIFATTISLNLIEHYTHIAKTDQELGQLLIHSSMLIYSSVAFGLLILVPTVILFFTVKLTLRSTPEEKTIRQKQDLSKEYILYVVTYIIPFVANDLSRFSTLVGVTILMVTIGILYIRTNLFYTRVMFKGINFSSWNI